MCSLMKKLSSAVKKSFGALPILYVLFALIVGASDYAVPDKLSLKRNELSDASVNVMGVSESCTVKAKLFGILPIKDVDVTVVEDDKLLAGGNIFGVKFFTKGVMVIRQSEIETEDGNINPSMLAGLEVGDVILSVDGTEVNTVEQLSEIVEKSYGKELEVEYSGDGKKHICILKPVLSLTDRKYKTGIWVRDSTAGIGTVTYYNPESGYFAGLGHGICDVDTGKLMPLLRGSVVDVEITDVIKGKKGMPGEIKGSFGSAKKGAIVENSKNGVYGTLDEVPVCENEKMYGIALKDEIKKGEAMVLSQLDSNGVSEYSIEIEKISDDDDDYKNLVIHVTDKALLEKTGGIVQGMSGSPIIQNGKIIGAVTHVCVNL